MKKIYSTFIMILILTLLSGPNVYFGQTQRLLQNKRGNLELHIVTDENVKIKVFIDDKLAVNEQFYKQKEENNTGIAPHKIFYFNLRKGVHTLRAEAVNGEQIFAGRFQIRDKSIVIKQSFELFTAGAAAVFDDMVNNNYIARDGLLLEKAYTIKKSSELELSLEYKEWELRELFNRLKQSDKRWLSLTYVDPQRIEQPNPFTMQVYDYKIMYE